MGKYGRCPSMPSTSSSWTTLLESLPGETWPLDLKAKPPEPGKEATLLGDLVGERAGSRTVRETWGRRTKRGRPEQRRTESSGCRAQRAPFLLRSAIPLIHISAHFFLLGQWLEVRQV